MLSFIPVCVVSTSLAFSLQAPETLPSIDAMLCWWYIWFECIRDFKLLAPSSSSTSSSTTSSSVSSSLSYSSSGSESQVSSRKSSRARVVLSSASSSDKSTTSSPASTSTGWISQVTWLAPFAPIFALFDIKPAPVSGFELAELVRAPARFFVGNSARAITSVCSACDYASYLRTDDYNCCALVGISSLHLTPCPPAQYGLFWTVAHSIVGFTVVFQIHFFFQMVIGMLCVAEFRRHLQLQPQYATHAC